VGLSRDPSSCPSAGFNVSTSQFSLGFHTDLLLRLLQLALAVLNILEHRNARTAGSRVPLPPYAESRASVPSEPVPQSNDRDLEFELDAQSLRSFESYSSVKKPEPVNVKVLKQ
jgi:hypothetical protein